MLVVPPARHRLEALTDAAILLTVAKQRAEAAVTVNLPS